MTLELDDPVTPPNPDPTNQLQFELWKLDIKEHRTKIQEYSNFRAGLYNVVIGQCTESLQDKSKSHQDFLAAYQDGIELLLLIKELTYTYEERRNYQMHYVMLRNTFTVSSKERTCPYNVIMSYSWPR